jgi:hypothetical protein
MTMNAIAIMLLCAHSGSALAAGPRVEVSVLVATIDVSDVNVTLDPIHFAVPQYFDGSSHEYLYRGPGPCDPNEPVPRGQVVQIIGEGPCLHLARHRNYGATVTVAQTANLDLNFAIANWPIGLPAGWPYSVTITLGNQSQTAAFGVNEITFKNVVGTRLPLVVRVNGAVSTNGRPTPVTIPGVLPLVVNRKPIGA